MISLTFPDGSSRDFKPGVTGRDVAESISKSLGKKAVAMALDGKVKDLAEPIKARRQDPHSHPRRSGSSRAHPSRRRPCDGRGRAGALSRHASHHRAGDRERLLLRLRQARAVYAGRPAGHRSQDARDRRARLAVHLRGDGPGRGEEAVRQDGRKVQARADRRHPRRRGDQDLFASANGSISAAARI